MFLCDYRIVIHTVLQKENWNSERLDPEEDTLIKKMKREMF